MAQDPPTEKQFDEKVAAYGTRLDQRTKLSLMAAVIFGTADIPEEDSVEAAFKIDRLVGDKLRWNKHQFRQQRAPLTPQYQEEKEKEGNEIPRKS